MRQDDATITADPAGQLAEAQAEAELLERELREALKEQQEAAAARVQYLGSILQSKVDERVALRGDVEQRWLKNLRQINGIYESEDLPPKEDADEFGSRVYVPLTRRLRNLAEARLGDMLFPGDDRAWVLEPSPKADLADVATLLKKLPKDAPISKPGQPPMKVSDMQAAIEDVQKEAEIRANRMQDQVDDRLAEAKWSAKARRSIGDAIDYGTGVVKGPIAQTRTKRVVRPREGGGYSIVEVSETVPTVEYVPLWNFYPDMSATSMEECVDVAQAHHMSRGELQGLRDQPGFNPAAIDMVLAGDPRQDNKTRRADLRELAGLSSAKDPRYVMWEWHGPISGSDLNACSQLERLYSVTKESVENEPDADGMGEPATEERFDDEEDYDCVVWFCDGIVVKAIVQPLRSNQRHIYSILWWQRDKASIFGYGLPDEVRDQQASANGSFRAMLDNMALCAGPQIVFDDDIIKPLDGRKEMRPFKLWKKVDRTVKAQDAFMAFNIESRVGEFGNLFDRSKQLMDEIATMPAFGVGSEQPNYLQSATGASLAYNSSTLWVRRVVRHWDDDVIEPMMGRMIDWEMDFNPDESIKGDFHPTARGITALVELEGQGQRMVAFTQLAQSMGVPLKDQMRILRRFARTLKLDPDEMLPTEDEIESMEPQPDPNQLQAEQRAKNAELVHDAKMKTLSLKSAEIEARSDEYARREKLALMELASRERLTMEQAARKYGYDVAKLDAEMLENEARRRHEAQMQNSEIALKLRAGSGI